MDVKWKLQQNNMTKKGPFFGPQNVRKKFKLPLAAAAGQISYNLKKHLNRFATMKGPKLDFLDHFWFQGGPLSDPF